MFEHMNIINSLHEQIEALLDLMQCAEGSTDIKSMNTAAEMCQTMMDDLMEEIAKIDTEWSERRKAKSE